MTEPMLRRAQGVIDMMWNQMETAHFTLFFDERDAAMAGQLRLRIDETFNRVVRDFSLAPTRDRYDFYLCPDVPAFLVCTGRTAETYEPWMVGNADDVRKRLCVLSPRVVRDRPPEAMDQVITHEIVHIAMDALCPGDVCPLWLGEGIATLYAGQVWVRGEERCPLISELEADFIGNGGYDYAGAYVWYFIEQYGAERFRRVYAGDESVGVALYPGFEREAVDAWLRRFG